MRSSLPLLLLLLALALPAPSSAAELLLPSWLVGREDDARWLMEEGERPRALISLGENGVEVILHLPGLDPAEILRKIEEYAVYEQTELVESSFCASGAFFTGTRLKAVGIDVYTPTVTRYWTELGTGRLHMGWDLMPVDASRDYLRAHRDALAASLRRAGLDRDVDAYLAESLDKLGPWPAWRAPIATSTASTPTARRSTPPAGSRRPSSEASAPSPSCEPRSSPPCSAWAARISRGRPGRRA